MRIVAEQQHFLGAPAIIASEKMRDVLALVERAARTQATVLITGESGTGKEVVARAIHHYSLRCAKPWVDLSCAALPEHLMESELFGYEKGAFSGADSLKQGLFELAHMGTLFLDEIGELDPKMQVKLLRVLDGTPYYRLGGVRKIAVDVRVLAATNQNLESAVETARFRADLFHRLSQIVIHVPPLRERKEDILPLAEFFLRQQNPRLCFTGPVREELLRRRWAGNVRQLRNAVVRAAAVAEEDGIVVADLPPDPASAPLVPIHDTRELTVRATDAQDGFSLDRMERHMIQRVLEQTGGHHQRAAKLLGISRRTLSRKLKLYDRSPSGHQCHS